MLPIQILEPENNGNEGGISMFQVALIIILSIFILGTCIGFLYRAKGGLGSRFINSNTTTTTTTNNSSSSNNGSITVDVVGVLFFLYSLILTFLEVIFSSSSLSTTITTTTDLIVHYTSSSSSLNQNIIPQYPYNLSIITSLLTLLIATHLLRQEAIHIKSALMIVCSVMTKLLIITSNSYTPSSSSSSSISQHVTEVLTVLGSLVLLFLPFVTNYSNSDNYSSTQQQQQWQQQWQQKVIKKIESKIRLHTLLFFPIASYFLSHYYFIISLEDDTPALNIFAMYWMAWGLYSISLIVYLLPQNGGSEGIKQAAVVSLLLGIVTALFCSRSSSGYDDEYYQYYSSIIQHDEKNSRKSATTSSGKWGLVVAITSWLFALSGPLRSLALKTSVRRSSSSQSKNNRTTVGGKSSAVGTFNLSNGGFQDDLLLVQLFLFALFFGSGLAWFIVMEMFENEGIGVKGDEEKDIFNKTVTMISCIITAFLGTFTTTLAVYLELHQLEDSLLSLVKCLLTLPTLFSLLLAYLDWSSDDLYYNNTMKRGGSLTTYMVVCAIVSFSVGVGLRTRAMSHRNYLTRSIGNLGVLISWFISMILSLQSFGLSLLYSPTSSSYENSARVLNIPILIIVAVSSILTLLENESTCWASPGSSRGEKKSSFFLFFSPRRVRFGSPIGIRFHFESSEYFPKTMMLCGIVSVLLSSSIYILFLRGCRLDGNYDDDDNDWSSQLVEHLDLFKKNQYYVESSANIMMKLDENNNNNQDVQTTVDSMVHTKILHSRSMKIFAKLSGSGFCTSKSSYGPFLHLLGLIFVLPGIISILRYFLLLKGRSFLKTVAIVPFSLYPLLVCSGIHALRVLSLINLLVGGVVQTISMRNRSWKGKMHI